MSVGHRHHRGQAWLTKDNSAKAKRMLADSRVKASLAKPFKVDRSYDVLYLAGYSNDAKTIYIDKDLPQRMPDGVDITPLLVTHERTEKAILDAFGVKYDTAHHLATHAEEQEAHRLGIDWEKYSRWIEGYVAKFQKQTIERTPPDLCLIPYQDEHEGRLKDILAARKGNQKARQARAEGGRVADKADKSETIADPVPTNKDMHYLSAPGWARQAWDDLSPETQDAFLDPDYHRMMKGAGIGAAAGSGLMAALYGSDYLRGGWMPSGKAMRKDIGGMGWHGGLLGLGIGKAISQYRKIQDEDQAKDETERAKLIQDAARQRLDGTVYADGGRVGRAEAGRVTDDDRMAPAEPDTVDLGPRSPPRGPLLDRWRLGTGRGDGPGPEYHLDPFPFQDMTTGEKVRAGVGLGALAASPLVGAGAYLKTGRPMAGFLGAAAPIVGSMGLAQPEWRETPEAREAAGLAAVRERANPDKVAEARDMALRWLDPVEKASRKYGEMRSTPEPENSGLLWRLVQQGADALGLPGTRMANDAAVVPSAVGAKRLFDAGGKGYRGDYLGGLGDAAVGAAEASNMFNISRALLGTGAARAAAYSGGDWLADKVLGTGVPASLQQRYEAAIAATREAAKRPENVGKAWTQLPEGKIASGLAEKMLIAEREAARRASLGARRSGAPDARAAERAKAERDFWAMENPGKDKLHADGGRVGRAEGGPLMDDDASMGGLDADAGGGAPPGGPPGGPQGMNAPPPDTEPDPGPGAIAVEMAKLAKTTIGAMAGLMPQAPPKAPLGGMGGMGPPPGGPGGPDGGPGGLARGGMAGAKPGAKRPGMSMPSMPKGATPMPSHLGQVTPKMIHAEQLGGLKRLATPHLADGGMAREPHFLTTGAVPLAYATGGRTDAHDVTVKEGSYILPADCLSALGENNTAAGAKVADGMFKSPLGHPPSAQIGGSLVPIKISGGEYVIAPEDIVAKFGSLEQGHKVLDEFVKNQRAKHIDTLKSLPGPAA